VREEGARQGGAPADASHAGPEGGGHVTEIVGAQVGEFLPFDVPPEDLNGIKVRCIARQSLHRQPAALAGEVRAHLATLVGRQTIPDQHQASPGGVALEGVQEGDEPRGVIAPGAGLEDELTAPAVPAERQGGRDGELLPVERVDQDGGVAARRPRAPDWGAL
jgi:hypothetical protein